MVLRVVLLVIGITSGGTRGGKLVVLEVVLGVALGAVLWVILFVVPKWYPTPLKYPCKMTKFKKKNEIRNTPSSPVPPPPCWENSQIIPYFF